MTNAVATDETLDWPARPAVAAFFTVELIVSTVRIVNIQLLMSNLIPRKSHNVSKPLLAVFS